VERPFFDHWIINVVSEEDPHLQRWVDREETAVARARDSVRALDARHPVAGADVLDIGCQNGAKLVALAQAGAVPHGIDVVAEAVVAAGFRGDSYELDLDARVGDACNLDFPDESMDIVCSNDVYEHVPDKMAMLDENIRVLRPGGLLAIIAPQRFSLKHLLSDPHYGHPGLSILPGSAAGWVNRKVYHEAVYEVETLPTRTRTAMEMKRRGIRLLSEPEPGIRGVARRGVDELRQVFQLFGIKE
jgi:SAM-dependent methyltransferase